MDFPFATINLVDKSFEELVENTGKCSGKNVDKFEQFHINKVLAENGSAYIEGIPAYLEATRKGYFETGDQEQAKKGAKSVAIFYGAGHMPHFHDRLTQIGFSVEKTRWLNAWDLRSPVADSTERTGN